MADATEVLMRLASEAWEGLPWTSGKSARMKNVVFGVSVYALASAAA